MCSAPSKTFNSSIVEMFSLHEVLFAHLRDFSLSIFVSTSGLCKYVCMYALKLHIIKYHFFNSATSYVLMPFDVGRRRCGYTNGRS